MTQIKNKQHSKKQMSQPKSHFSPVTFSECDGIRYLHFGTEWVQGAMRLRAPKRIELEYAQQMMAWLLFLNPPKHIVQLGLGAATLTQYAYHQFKKTLVSAVEINPAVTIAARCMFALPPDDKRLKVIEGDAWEYVNDQNNENSIGVMQIDLYNEHATGPVLNSLAFYRACRNCLTSPGMAMINLFGDHPSFKKNMRHLNQAFDNRVIALPLIHEGNQIALAFSGPLLSFEWAQLTERARYIEETFKLPAKNWLKLLKLVTENKKFFII